MSGKYLFRPPGNEKGIFRAKRMGSVAKKLPDFHNRLELYGHCSLVESLAMDFSGRHYPEDLILQTICLLTRKRGKKAATRFFRKAICLNGAPEKVTVDGVEHMILKGQYDKTRSGNDREYLYSLVA